jgi:hypothetical protein
MIVTPLQRIVLFKKDLLSTTTMNQPHPEVKEALAFLDTLTPDDIHLKTNATLSQIMDFQSIWWRHTPSAARYYLLPSYWEGTLTAKE